MRNSRKGSSRVYHGPETKSRSPIRDTAAYFRRHRNSFHCDGKTAAEWTPPLPVKPFSQLSLVGMSQSARKRAARRCPGCMECQNQIPDIDHGVRCDSGGTFAVPPLEWLSRFHIGERLRPCPGCLKCWDPCYWCEDFETEGDICEHCGRVHVVDIICDGSGLIVTRIRCPGDAHFLIAERRWTYTPDCRLCTGHGTVKFPLDRSGPKCPGCCNCAVGVCKKRAPDGLCAEDYMHCVDGVISP